jgi:hypothetical protein
MQAGGEGDLRDEASCQLLLSQLGSQQDKEEACAWVGQQMQEQSASEKRGPHLALLTIR